MSKLVTFAIVVFLVFLAAIVWGYYLLPFGPIPKLAAPNCGPEQRDWLKVRLEDKEDFLAYLQGHELELFSGSSTPYLGALPAEWQVERLDVSMDWEAITEGIQVERRLGYSIYSITYTHPLCGKNQHYVLRMTSFGQASLYGCCGI